MIELVIAFAFALHVWRERSFREERAAWTAERHALLRMLVPGLQLETATEPARQRFDDEGEWAVEQERVKAGAATE